MQELWMMLKREEERGGGVEGLFSGGAFLA